MHFCLAQITNCATIYMHSADVSNVKLPLESKEKKHRLYHVIKFSDSKYPGRSDYRSSNNCSNSGVQFT